MVNGEARTGEPKTRAGRRNIALDPATVAALRSHRVQQAQHRLAFGGRWQDTGLVVTREDGSPASPQIFSKSFVAEARKAGLPRIRLHDLRHSWATAALGAGVPAKVVSERLGHANIAITLDTYSHVMPQMDQAAADTVAASIFGG